MTNPTENLSCACCTECGSDNLAGGDQKANGTEFECRDCGHKFLFDTSDDEWDGDEDRE